MPEKVEFEYIRHRTISLIGFLDVVSGTIPAPFLNKTRKAEDFAMALRRLFDTDPGKYWIIIADNLNTHYSEQVVRLVGELCGITDLGQPKEFGPLKDKDSRIAFLTDRSHRIRFAFTPKHCSWINQIENWFGKINGQLLRGKSFQNIEELKSSILRYIEQYNSMFAKPYEWKYITTPLGDYIPSRVNLNATG